MQGHIKLNSFYTATGTINTMKGQPMEWDKIFGNHISDKGLCEKYTKSSYNSRAKNKQ